jgi:hypothetical protein
MALSKTAFSKLEYEFFISPQTGLTNERLNDIIDIELSQKGNGLYSISKEKLKELFELKFDLQGTGGRASDQPIEFSVHRRLGPDGRLRHLTQPEIETLLRDHLGLKPKYLQTAGLIKNINRS